MLSTLIYTLVFVLIVLKMKKKNLVFVEVELLFDDFLELIILFNYLEVNPN